MYRCNAGYTGPDGGTCTACAAGKYKVALGSADCSPCVGVYSHSPEASADSKFCGCNVGYTGPDGSTCTACEAGKYKVIIGKDVCFDCPAGKFKAGQGSGTCTHCQKGIYIYIYMLHVFIYIKEYIRFNTTQSTTKKKCIYKSELVFILIKIL